MRGEFPLTFMLWTNGGGQPDMRVLTYLFDQVPSMGQVVEKVAVGPVGSSRQAQNTSKPVPKHYSTGVFSPLNRAQTMARRSFSTRWCILGMSFAGSCISHPYRTGAGRHSPAQVPNPKPHMLWCCIKMRDLACGGTVEQDKQARW